MTESEQRSEDFTHGELIVPAHRQRRMHRGMLVYVLGFLGMIAVALIVPNESEGLRILLLGVFGLVFSVGWLFATY